MMMLEGMSTVRGAIGRWVAVVALASGLAMASPARADSWKDAMHDADDLHHAAEELHERAVRLHDHHVMPVTAALDQAAADLYHALRYHPSAAEVVPLLERAESLLSQTASAIGLSHDMHRDRKTRALLKDARHHFAHAAEHVECVLHDHHSHRSRRTPPRGHYYPQPRPSWYGAPYGGHYAPPPPALWGSHYR